MPCGKAADYTAGMTVLGIRVPTRGVALRAPRSRGAILWLAVLLLAGSFLVVQVGRQVYASWAINQQVAQVREQIAGVEARNAELQRELDFLRSPAYISEQARRLLTSLVEYWLTVARLPSGKHFPGPEWLKK